MDALLTTLLASLTMTLLASAPVSLGAQGARGALPGADRPQPASGRTAELTPEQTRRALADVGRLVTEHFVQVDRRAAVVAALRQAQAAGRYAVSDPRALAARVTEDLLRAGRDRHFALIYDPAAYAAAAAAAAARSQAADPAAATREAAPEAALKDERARLTNHGLEEMRILGGNVRYLRIQSFPWRPDVTGLAYDGAMRFLKDGDAVIVDLRTNGGGNASAVRYAVSHFLPADREQLLATFQDDQGRPDQSRALGYLAAGRVRAPLYVLTSRATGSAAEEFAQHVKGFRLGTLVGDTTHGAGNNNRLLPVPPGFLLSVAFFAPAHPVLGNVEGVGVAPDVAVPPTRALEAAHVRALEALAAGGPAARRPAHRWARTAARAAADPVVLPPAALARYAGVYGERSVRLRGDTLVYQRQGGPEIPLTPLGDHTFALAGTTELRLRFDVVGAPVNGPAPLARALYSDGTVAAFPRTR